MTYSWIKYAYHKQGCEALPSHYEGLSNLPRWPSHEEMVMDVRCTCGLRDLATSNTAYVEVEMGA